MNRNIFIFERFLTGGSVDGGPAGGKVDPMGRVVSGGVGDISGFCGA